MCGSPRTSTPTNNPVVGVDLRAARRGWRNLGMIEHFLMHSTSTELTYENRH